MEQNAHAKDLLELSGISLDEVNQPPSCSINERDQKPSSQSREGFLPSDLHGVKPPSVDVHKEKPIHRAMALMSVKGATYREIAKATGYSAVQVSTLMRQPWMREMVVHLISEAGLDPVLTLLQSEGMNSVMKLIDLRESAPPPIQLGATKELLDRLFGKAPQHIITEKKMPEDPKAEAERLKQEVAEMQKDLQTGNNIHTNAGN